MTASGVIVSGVSKRFGALVALNDCSFTASRGEFVTIVGPSGCGKTTLLRIIAGLDAQDAGEIAIRGQQTARLSAKARDVAMVFQDFSLYPHMTVRRNIGYPLEVIGRSRSERDESVLTVADTLGIQHTLDRLPRQLSGGEAQRAAIAKALLRRPSLFLLDEPLSNVDAQLRATLRGEIRAILKATGETTLFVTHDQQEAMALADRVIVMRSGGVVQEGTPGEIYHRPATMFVAQFFGRDRISVVDAKYEDGEFRLVGGSSESVRIPAPMLQVQSGQEVSVAIRAESVRVSVDSESEPIATVESLEATFPHPVARLRIRNEQLLYAEVSTGSAVRGGATVKVDVDPEGLIVFDKNEPFRRLWPA